MHNPTMMGEEISHCARKSEYAGKVGAIFRPQPRSMVLIKRNEYRDDDVSNYASIPISGEGCCGWTILTGNVISNAD